MRLLSKCPGCSRICLLLKKRKYLTKHGGLITSQKEVCTRCMLTTRFSLSKHRNDESRNEIEVSNERFKLENKLLEMFYKYNVRL